MDKVIIYTDGGCSPNPGAGGWAAVLISPLHNFEKKIYGAQAETTNNRMEITAAIEALKSLKRPCEVELHTDSQYLQKAFTDGWLDKWQKNNWRTKKKTDVLNKDLWQELLRISEKHKIDWKWVKGHSDDKYNDICDSLVQKARDELKRQPPY